GLLVLPGLVDLHVHLREPGEEGKETTATGTRAAAAGGVTTVVAMPNTKPVCDSASVARFVQARAREAGFARVRPAGRITRVSLVQRALRLAAMPGAHLHVAHVSAAGTVRAIREARARGVRVTAEATPHHFTLTDEAVAGALASVPAFRQEDAPPVEPYDTHAKMSPPLRSESDRQAIVGALSDGIIDAIATDHAPHGPLEKDVEFERAANGVIGLETSLALTLALVRAG